MQCRERGSIGWFRKGLDVNRHALIERLPSKNQTRLGVSHVIAIVDDDESFRRALARFLGTFAFCVRTFASGAEFLRSGELGVVECLLLDLAMPGMSGLEVKQQLAVRGLRIPTVFVTAHADDEMEQHLLAAGAIAMLPKPVDQEKLLRLVQGVVGQ
jgi:FixJ family two-component response regulator